MSTTEATTRAIVEAIYASLLCGDVAAVMAGLHDDVELEVHGPTSIPFAGRYRGRADLERFFEVVAYHVERDPADPVPAVHQYVAEGDHVVAIGMDRVNSRTTGSTWRRWWGHLLELRD